MYTNNKLAKSIRLALMFGGASLAFSGSAMAQDQAEEQVKEAQERIQVTGSRISRTDIETSSPVQIIDRSDIEATGKLSIGDILQDIPSAGAALNTAFNNGGNGSTNMDLRNLGAQRLLVLVNGRRWLSSLGSTVDLNTIPASAVERIEVLKDGASAVYGSDAIAGVVNIITRRDFDGVEMSAYVGENLSEGDGRQYTTELTFGTTSSKGALLFNMSHVTQQPIWAGDREISSTGGSTTNETGRVTLAASSLDPATIAYIESQGITPNANGFYDMEPDGEGGFAQYPNRLYNYAPDNYLVTPQERNSFYVQGHYDLADDVRLVGDFVLTQRKSAQELAPMPVTLGAAFGAAASRVDIHADNIYNPFGETLYGDASRAPNPDGYQPFALQRRFVEAGSRRYEQNDLTYRSMIGLEGFLDNGWTWDAHYIYGENSATELTTGLLNLTRINQALGANCTEATGCVPLNLFGGPGSITQEMVDYVSFDSVARSGLEMKNYAFNIGGDLFEMPAGYVGMAFGVERREESGYDTPDPLTASGESSGNQRDATSGSFRLDEAYIEFSIPLLETLLLTPAMRYSDHSTFGSESTAKVGLEFRPIDDLLIRGTWAQGYRAPSISNLYSGNADSYPSWTDPCNTLDEDGNPLDMSSKPGCANVPIGYEQANTQIRITLVSSPDLKPETSTSKTLGVVYNPSWLEGAEFTADYYQIEVEDSIGRYGHVRIARECSEDANSPSCEFIERDPAGNITDLRNFLTNAGTYNVEGIDMFLGYNFDVADYGSFRAGIDASYVIENLSDGEDQQGLQYGDAGYPDWKANISLDWSRGDWDAHWRTRYVGPMDSYYHVYGYYAYYGVPESTYTSRFGSYFTHDVSVGWNMSDNVRFQAGINNLFAKEPTPEYAPGGVPNNDWAMSTNNFSVTEYDVNMDRFGYARVTINF